TTEDRGEEDRQDATSDTGHPESRVLSPHAHREGLHPGAARRRRVTCTGACRTHELWASRACTILSAARPSQPRGRPDRLPVLRAAARASFTTASADSRATGHGTNRLVPSRTVMGRSVDSRSVMHGMPSAVFSSWTPPLSANP